MLTHHRKPVCLSLVSTDLPVWSVVEAAGTLYQKDKERFHLLLTEPTVQDHLPQREALDPTEVTTTEVITNGTPSSAPRLLWLEISPYRVIMTMQGSTQFSYRHFWEQGVYGLSRYWLQSESLVNNGQLRLRNFTRRLTLQSGSLPEYLRVEYELWSDKVQLGCYVLNLEIHP
ncbi:MAG: hypothetical protein VKJ46_07990 [Leptolyngbyaceae bacterium]|nr:hypothetical protein [Leptolyngbyaceae bacterium]